jgi:hypothetical protein
MVLVEGENADGATVDQDNFDLAEDNGSAPLSGPEQVIAAIMGTREGAAEAGCDVLSAGVTWSDQAEATALRDALADRRIENVMLVSSFLAAAALAQAVGNASGYARTALLFVEPDTATLAVVNTADGSIADVHRLMLPDDDDQAVAALAGMVADAETLDAQPGGVFVVGSGVDVPLIKPALDAATSLTVVTPEEPELALARGAALASANAPLFVSSTAALAYALDPGTGAVLDPYALDPSLFDLAAAPVATGAQQLAYSAVPTPSGAYTMAADEYAPYQGVEADEFGTGMFTDFIGEPVERAPRRPFLTAMSVMTIFVVGVVALVLSLAVAIRPHIAQRPSLSHNLVAPAHVPPPAAAVPAPPVQTPAPAPAPAAAPLVPRAPVAPAPPPAFAPAPPPALVPLPPVFAPPPPVAIPPLIPRIFAPVPGPPLGGPPGGFGGPHGGGGFGGPHGGFGPGFGGGHGGFGHGRR